MGNKVYKEKHKQEGLCIDCNEYAEPGVVRCSRHAEKNRDNTRKTNRVRKERYKENGCCPSCGIELHPEMDENKINCLNCRERPK